MGLSNREFIGRALGIMAEGLEPFIRATIEQVAPGIEWTRILEHKDDLQHKEPKLYNHTDPQVQLRMLTERLGGLGYPFNLSPDCRAYASEMRQVRNLWAHTEPFTDDDVQRYLDTSFRLLHAVGAEDAAEQTRSVLTEFKSRTSEHGTDRAAVAEPSQTETQGKAPQVAEPPQASPSVLPTDAPVALTFDSAAVLRDYDDPRIADALDTADGLFVKNLENVEGDERDTILFSTGFSKNDRGYLPLNFGPLNRSGGERRLNVAVTRARRQVIVFSSFDPTDLRAEETSSVGVKHLRSYLELAAHGPSALPFDGRRKPAVDRHREQIADALREQGFGVTTDVGLSDFKVDISVSRSDEPERPVMAVLLDSPAWASRATVGDRDGLP